MEQQNIFGDHFLRSLEEIHGYELPDVIRPGILAALADPERSEDMVLQLARFWKRPPAWHLRDTVQFSDGKLLHGNNAGEIVHGTTVYPPEPGCWPKEQRPLVVGGKACWVEQTKHGHEEWVVWNGRRGKSYPRSSIGDIVDCGGVPCYPVSWQPRSCGPYTAFVVWDETEGERHNRVENLCVVGGKPAYVADDDDPKRRTRVVLGTECVYEGRYVTSMIVWKDALFFQAQADHESPCQIRTVDGPILEGVWVHGPSVVRGELAYAVQETEGDKAVVRLDGKFYEIPGQVNRWCLPLDSRADNPHVVFDLRQGGIYVDHMRVGDGEIANCGLTWPKQPGESLRIERWGPLENQPMLVDLDPVRVRVRASG